MKKQIPTGKRLRNTKATSSFKVLPNKGPRKNNLTPTKVKKVTTSRLFPRRTEQSFFLRTIATND